MAFRCSKEYVLQSNIFQNIYVFYRLLRLLLSNNSPISIPCQEGALMVNKKQLVVKKAFSLPYDLLVASYLQ